MTIFLVAVSKLMVLIPSCQKFLFGKKMWQNLSWCGEISCLTQLNGHFFYPSSANFHIDFDCLQVMNFLVLLLSAIYVFGSLDRPTLWDKANFGAGLEYGYSLPIATRLNLDFNIGLGYFWGEYQEYIPQDNCYVWQSTKYRVGSDLLRPRYLLYISSAGTTLIEGKEVRDETTVWTICIPFLGGDDIMYS